MARPAIIVDRLGKSYRLGQREERYPTFREALIGAVKSPLRRLRGFSEHGTETDTFWALKGVSFEVQPGEVVGIIGRNGAGKSTLLKVLSRITEPTEGCVRLRGRVASLLEVGTGFHPELTGRENIYLSGSILGMRRAEIERKFDEIVAFSGVERFIDTPVKRYSSGMYVRLAFAVAAHLDPETLIIDEVLSVGDASFQKKCLGKMKQIAGSGRTVLYVSHILTSVNDLCTRAILMQEGRIVADGQPKETIELYLAEGSKVARMPLAERTDRRGRGGFRFTDVAIRCDGERANCVTHGGEVTFDLSFEGKSAVDPHSFRTGLYIYQPNGGWFMAFDSGATSYCPERMDIKGVLRCTVPDFPIIRGTYRATAFLIVNGHMEDMIDDAVEFEVVSGRYPDIGQATVRNTWETI